MNEPVVAIDTKPVVAEKEELADDDFVIADEELFFDREALGDVLSAIHRS